MGYLCVNFSIPRPLYSRLRPDVRDRQTGRRQTASSLNAPALGVGHNNNNIPVSDVTCHFPVNVRMFVIGKCQQDERASYEKKKKKINKTIMVVVVYGCSL